MVRIENGFCSKQKKIITNNKSICFIKKTMTIRTMTRSTKATRVLSRLPSGGFFHDIFCRICNNCCFRLLWIFNSIYLCYCPCQSKNYKYICFQKKKQ